MNKRICKVVDCDNKLKSRDYCNKHWRKFKRYGDPLYAYGRLKYGFPVKDMPEYRVWKGMKTRCYNKNFHKYPIYGARGIAVCDRWKDNFLVFLEDMGKRSTPNLTIERIDVNGNYEPSNCMWADKTTQARNQRVRKDNISGYRGVYITPNNRYKVLIQINGKQKLLGDFKYFEHAVIARRTAENEFWK